MSVNHPQKTIIILYYYKSPYTLQCTCTYKNEVLCIEGDNTIHHFNKRITITSDILILGLFTTMNKKRLHNDNAKITIKVNQGIYKVILKLKRLWLQSFYMTVNPHFKLQYSEKWYWLWWIAYQFMIWQLFN